jgi:protein-tyrosine-phosphatase
MEHIINAEHAKRKKKTPAQKKVRRKRAASVLLYPIAPFRPFMVKALQKDGLKITGKGRRQKLNGKPVTLVDVVLLFKKHVIDNQPYTGNYFSQTENVVGAATAGAGIGLEISAGLVRSIINWIKDLIGKKKRGEKLTPKQEAIVDAYEKTEDQINEAARGEVNEGIGDFITTNFVYIAVALLALYFLLKKK